MFFLRLFEVPHQKFFHTLTKWRAPAFQEMSLTQQKKLWKENLFNNFSAFVAFSSLQCSRAKRNFCCIQFPQWFFPVFAISCWTFSPLFFVDPENGKRGEKKSNLCFLNSFFWPFLEFNTSENVRHLYRHRITSCDDLWLYFLLHKFLAFFASSCCFVDSVALKPFGMENVTKSFFCYSVSKAFT